jgi:hypothetical protein
MASTTATQIQQNQVGFAPEIAPYGQNLLGTTAGTVYQYQKDAGGQNVLDANGMPIISGIQPYQPYTGDRQAQFTPLQKQSFEGAQQMQPSYQLQGATGLAGLAGQQALNTNYNPLNYQSGSITGGMGGNMQPQGMPPQQGQMPQAPQSTLDQYMSPYVQNVVQRQQQDAQRQADIAAQGRGAQAARAGAFGGSGDYLLRSQAASNLARQKGDIEATGMQNAYTQALNQFNQEQQQRQQAAQLSEQSRQYGAGLGLQGLQTALTGAGQLNTIGQTAFGQNKDINALQNQYGLQQQNQMNTILGNQYQDYLNQQNQPYKQLGFMSDIIRGAPLSQMGSTIYSAAPSAVSQLAGLGATAYGASMKAANGGSIREQSYAKGGLVRERPAGLVELAIHKMA